MRKHLALLLALVLVLTTPLALAEGKIVINEKFDREQMLNIHGEMVKIETLDNLIGSIELGFAFKVPEYMNGYDDDTLYPLSWSPVSRGYFYIPESVQELSRKLDEFTEDNQPVLSEEEFMDTLEKVKSALVYLFDVMRVDPEQEDLQEFVEQNRQMYEHAELLATDGDVQFFLLYNTNLKDKGLTEEEQAAVAEFIENGLELVKTGLILFPPDDFISVFGNETIKVPLEGGVEAFASEDLDGNPFSPEEFAKYDLTLVNIWSTGCGPCIEEMPELQALKEALPENINLITVCLDGERENELAKAIVEGVGATFTTLKGDELGRGVLKNVTATPTTLFISRDGMQLGEAVIGAMGSKEKFVEQSMNIIYERLGLIPPQE